MYLVGIDISKYKHDCFIATETGEVIKNSFSFANNHQGFNELLTVLKSLDQTQEIRIGLEATGHYGNNLKIFLNIVVSSDVAIKDLSADLQTKIKEKVKETTDLDVKEVNITVKKVIPEKTSKTDKM